MSRTATLLLLLAGMLSACGPAEVAPRLERFTLRAAYGTSYQIEVKLPESYDPVDPDGYALVLMLDGSYMTKPALKAFSKSGLQNHTILVTVDYVNENRRVQDYSPTPTAVAGTGNAAQFLSFIELDLLPHLRHAYTLSPDPARYTFCGHSLGGLFGTYLLLNRPGLFSNYVLISSALMWDEQAIFRLEARQRPAAKDQQAKVFLGMGTVEENGMHATGKHMVQLFKAFYPNLEVKQFDYKNRDHSGVIYPALTDGFHFVSNPSF